MGVSIVRNNLMTVDGYTPYCGNNICRWKKGGCHNPKTVFNGKQFECENCGWRSHFPKEFIDEYKEKWNK